MEHTGHILLAKSFCPKSRNVCFFFPDITILPFFLDSSSSFEVRLRFEDGIVDGEGEDEKEREEEEEGEGVLGLDKVGGSKLRFFEGITRGRDISNFIFPWNFN